MRFVAKTACAILAVLGLVLLLFRTSSAPSGTPIAWQLQPDSFPMGTVLQGSRVEMSLGLFSGLKPAPMPTFLTSLPPPLSKAADWTVEQFRTTAAKLSLRVRVEAPVFIEIERTEVRLHASQGPYVVISFRVKADSVGDWRSNLVVHLNGSAYGTTNISVPVATKVIGPTLSNTPAVLITETPYECYATGVGKDFEPLAVLNSRLSEQGVKVDFCRQLPPSVSNYRAILLGGSELAGLGPAQMGQLRKFVAGGGRLILAANAFFVPTVPKANTFLSSCGLQIIDRDAGLAITNSQVVSDLLTSGVNRVDFFRPSQIDVTDPAQGKLLVEAEDGHGGYVAVSRKPSRGEVIVLTQSLWWSWIRSNPAKADNLLLLETLLGH